MDEKLRKQILRDELQRTHKGKKIIPCRYRMKYPESGEREYLRLVNKYMAIEKEVLMKYLPELKQIIGENMYRMDSAKDNEKKRRTSRTQNIAEVIPQLALLFERIERELNASFGLFDLKRALTNIANLDHKLSIAEWKKAIYKTLGINLLDDYYSGEFYREALEKWVSENVELIKTVPIQSLSRIKEVVYQNYMNGQTATNIVKELQRQYGMSKSHARLIARDQTAKLNSDIAEHQQRDAGVERYKWSGSMDRRERESHRRLEGKIFSWNEPPETDGGRHCHPGKDFQCRCCAIPVFDLDTLDLPV